MIMQYPSEQTISVSSIISKKHMLGTIRSMFDENLKLNHWISEKKIKSGRRFKAKSNETSEVYSLRKI